MFSTTQAINVPILFTIPDMSIQARRSLAEIPATRRTAASLVDLLGGAAHGQYFELFIQDHKQNLAPIAVLAGSALHTVTCDNWHSALSLLACNLAADRDIGLLRVSREHGRAMLWRVPTDEWHATSFLSLNRALSALTLVAAEYRRGMRDLRTRLDSARSVDDWNELSSARLGLIKQIMTSVVEWAWTETDSTLPIPTLLLTGSASCELGLVSDIDFVPVWPSTLRHESAGREMLERLITGLNACGMNADNLAARFSHNRITALSLGTLSADLAMIASRWRFASAMAGTRRGILVGSLCVGKEVERHLAMGKWQPPGWQLRCVGWWAALQNTLAQAPPLPYPLLVPIHLRKVKVMSEIAASSPSNMERSASLRELQRLGTQLAWLRDVVCLSGFKRVDEEEAEYLARLAATMGFANPSVLASHWKALLTAIDSQAQETFNEAGLGFWQSRLGRTIAGWKSVHRAMERDAPPPKLFGNEAGRSETIVCRPFRLRL